MKFMQGEKRWEGEGERGGRRGERQETMGERRRRGKKGQREKEGEKGEKGGSHMWQQNTHTENTQLDGGDFQESLQL